jgi:hypothetical protein
MPYIVPYSETEATAVAGASRAGPRRTAILLIGGDKTGNGRWYAEFVPVADRLYDAHLDALRRNTGCPPARARHRDR